MKFEFVVGLDQQSEIFSLIIIGFQSLLAAAGGVGGGPVYSSVLIAFGATVHTSIPLAKTIIFSGSVILMCINMFQKSTTNKQKPAIMWDIVFFIQNSTILGAVVGSILNVLVPEWFLIFCGLLFFSYEGVNTTKKSITAIRKDRKTAKANATMEDVIKNESKLAQTHSDSLLITDDPKPNPQVQKISKCSHWAFVSKTRLVTFSIGIVASIGLTVARGLTKKCSTLYWVYLVLTFVCGMISIVITNISLHKSIVGREENVLIGGSDSFLTSMTGLNKYTAIGFGVGIVAAFIGIGGGIIYQPIMLGMGVPPFVARMASSTMITFTALASMSQYGANGQLDFNCVWVFMIVVGVFYPLGYFLSGYVIRCVKSTSVIQLAMGVSLLIADCFMVFRAVTTIVGIVKSGVLPGLTNICL